jgi:UDP-2,3-diacylglucosamine hydrolase
MKAIFIADAHLRRSREPGYRALVHFIRRLQAAGPEGKTAGEERGKPSAAPIPVTDLFLVGDVFDFWFSRKERIYPEFTELIDGLKRLRDQGIRIHLFEGNHDFYLEDYFSVTLGMNVYKDWAVIEDENRKMLVGHGDLVDQSNLRYLRLRGFLRSPFVFGLQRFLPLRLLWRIARFSSDMSKEIMGGADERIVKAMDLFAQDKFQEGFDAVILGHCHRAQLTKRLVGGKERYFATLGDWLCHNSYLHYDHGHYVLGSEKEGRNAASGLFSLP